MSAYDAGFRAAFDGRPVYSNPFPSDTPSFEDWDAGWFDCDSENSACAADCEADDYDYDDSMDGDHDSCMDSIGWGVDEDYGYYGDE